MGYLQQLIDVEITNPKTILITSNDIKSQILKYRNEKQIIDSLKIMTEHEFVTTFLFKSSFDNVLYLIDNNPWSKEQLNIEIALNLEQSLFLINTLNLSDHPLFDYLETAKQNGYIVNNPTIPSGYDIQLYLPRINDMLAANLVHAYPSSKTPSCQILEFEHFLEEIENAIESILKLIDEGVSLERIHLFAPSNYNSVITQVASVYSLPINSENNLRLLMHEDGRKVMNQFLNNEDIDLTTVEPLLLETILGILNKFAELEDKSKAKSLIKYQFENSKVTLNAVQGIKIHNKIESLYSKNNLENDYFIMLGNYQDGLISYAQDTNIISDQYRKQLANTDIVNKNENTLFYNILNNAKNSYVSYSKKLLNTSVSLANNLKDSKVVKATLKPKSDYRMSADILKFARANYINQTFNHQTTIYKEQVKNFDLQFNDNKFTGITRNDDNIKLSYTSINNYYKCAYKYYLSHVLRIKNGKFDNRKIIIGNIVHNVLENIDKIEDQSAENLQKIIEKFAKEEKIELNDFDHIYFNKLSSFLELVCVYMRSEEANSSFTTIEREFNCDMEIMPNIILEGKIDKVLSKLDGDNLLVEIYDYKTGSITIDIANAEYGLDLQNIIYFLLLKNYYKNEHGDEVLYGTFQQQIKPKILYDEEQPLDLMKIKGYSKQKNDIVFKRSEKIISETEVEQLLDVTTNKLKEAAVNISNNNYHINPKVINKKNVSCGYCEYANICNKTSLDTVYLNKEK